MLCSCGCVIQQGTSSFYGIPPDLRLGPRQADRVRRVRREVQATLGVIILEIRTVGTSVSLTPFPCLETHSFSPCLAFGHRVRLHER